ncbi:hypothetical protein JMUB6875_68430 [Nocardia sp. JMUB6875]
MAEIGFGGAGAGGRRLAEPACGLFYGTAEIKHGAEVDHRADMARFRCPAVRALGALEISALFANPPDIPVGLRPGRFTPCTSHLRAPPSNKPWNYRNSIGGHRHKSVLVCGSGRVSEFGYAGAVDLVVLVRVGDPYRVEVTRIRGRDGRGRGSG